MRVAQKDGSALAVKIIEEEADYAKVKAKYMLPTLEMLPKLINSGLLKDLENTASYLQKGCTGFYLDTIGTKLNGRFRFNPKGQTVQDMFKKVTENQYLNLPFTERATFFAGDQPLFVGLRYDPFVYGGRLFVLSTDSLPRAAPVVVNFGSMPLLEERGAEALKRLKRNIRWL